MPLHALYPARPFISKDDAETTIKQMRRLVIPCPAKRALQNVLREAAASVLARKRKYGGKHRHRSPFQIARADLVTAARASGDHIVNGQHSCCPDKSDTSAKEYDDAVVIIMDLVIRGTSTAIYRTVRNSCLTMPGAGSPFGSSQRKFETRRMRLRLNNRLLMSTLLSLLLFCCSC